MKTHRLKTWPPHFDAVSRGLKTFELRKDDGRGFNVGDVLELEEFAPSNSLAPYGLDGHYTGRKTRVVVTHLLRGGTPGLGLLPEHLVCLSIRREMDMAVPS